MKTRDEPGYPLACQRRAHLQKAILQASYKRHPNWPAELHPHEVEPDHAAVFLVEAAQPVEHGVPAASEL